MIELKRNRSEQDRQNLLAVYAKLNAEGRAKLNSYAEDLISIERYRDNKD